MVENLLVNMDKNNILPYHKPLQMEKSLVNNYGGNENNLNYIPKASK